MSENSGRKVLVIYKYEREELLTLPKNRNLCGLYSVSIQMVDILLYGWFLHVIARACPFRKRPGNVKPAKKKGKIVYYRGLMHNIHPKVTEHFINQDLFSLQEDPVWVKNIEQVH